MAVVCLLFGGCMIDDTPPPFYPGPQTCNNDGICQVAVEDCLSCPTDCPCCGAVTAEGNGEVENPSFAAGRADGRVARLGPLSGLTLAIGGAIFDLPGRVDFVLIGEVLSDSAFSSAVCTTRSGGVGAFEVQVSADGSSWQLIGIWSKQNNRFDVGCVSAGNIRWVRLQGQVGAQAELDALEASSCCESDGSCAATGITQPALLGVNDDDR